MANTDSLAVVTQYLYDKIVTSKAALGLPVATDITNVFYGDQDLIQFTPCICIEPDQKRRTLNGVRRRTENEFRVGILVYEGDHTDPQNNRKATDLLAEAIETLIHADATFGANPNQLVIHSLVESIESGYKKKGNSVLRMSRLMVTATSQTILPPSP